MAILFLFKTKTHQPRGGVWPFWGFHIKYQQFCEVIRAYVTAPIFRWISEPGLNFQFGVFFHLPCNFERPRSGIVPIHLEGQILKGSLSKGWKKVRLGAWFWIQSHVVITVTPPVSSTLSRISLLSRRNVSLLTGQIYLLHPQPQSDWYRKVEPWSYWFLA